MREENPVVKEKYQIEYGNQLEVAVKFVLQSSSVDTLMEKFIPFIIVKIEFEYQE